jgi:hypothetical protein
MTEQRRVAGGTWRRSRGGRIALVLAAVLEVAGLGARAGADETFRCELKEARGVPPADAQTASELVCDELRRASGGRGAYDVELRTLGKVVVVTASREEPAGSVTVQVAGVEEVPTAAPRIADALVRGLGFATTQRVDNLLETETRKAPVKKGSVKFSLGVADVESPGHGARAAGFSLGLMYATPRFSLPAELRVAWDESSYGEKRLDLFSISVGGRAYLSRRDVSPFLGGGLGLLHLGADEGGYPELEGDYFYADSLGIAPYVEAGVEMLRLHRGRVALLVRADIPLRALESPEIPPYSYPDAYGRPGPAYPGRPAESRYVVPVSIGVSVAF